MRTGITLIFICIALISNGQQSDLNYPHIEITGSADTSVVPDKILLEIILNSRDLKGDETIASLEKKMLSSLKELSIDVEKRLYVKDVVANFQKHFLRTNKQESYKTYNLVLGTANQVKNTIIKLQEYNINRISIVSFDFIERNELENELKVEAIRQAKINAKALSQELNQNIGKAIFISDQTQAILEQLSNRTLGLNSNNWVKSNEKSLKQEDTLLFQKIKLTGKVLVKFELN